jgi:hypothetical protein
VAGIRTPLDVKHVSRGRRVATLHTCRARSRERAAWRRGAEEGVLGACCSHRLSHVSLPSYPALNHRLPCVSLCLPCLPFLPADGEQLPDCLPRPCGQHDAAGEAHARHAGTLLRMLCTLCCRLVAVDRGRPAAPGSSTQPCRPVVGQQAALPFYTDMQLLLPPCFAAKRIASSQSKMACCSCCKPATASAPAPQPSWCAPSPPAAALLAPRHLQACHSCRACLQGCSPSHSITPQAPCLSATLPLPPSSGRGGNGARGPRQPCRVCADGGAPPLGPAAAPHV